MNVLSLFDGISCGRLALERSGIPVTNYFASEVDRSAIQISKANWPDIQHIGDVTEVKADDLPKIDLIIGGSPCQGFSSAGKGLNFEDPRSRLFFEYVRLKDETNATWALLENVRMKKEWSDIISLHMKCRPVFINSSTITAQSRQRLYWANFEITPPTENNVTLTDVIDSGWFADKPKSFCIDANYGKGSNMKNYFHRGRRQIVFRDGFDISTRPDDESIVNEWGRIHRDQWRLLTVAECERLQTLPVGYTAAVKSKVDRYKAIGNGWTVDVITHIFKQLKKNMSDGQPPNTEQLPLAAE